MAGAVGKVGIPPLLRDFQTEGESPVFGLFHAVAFSTAPFTHRFCYRALLKTYHAEYDKDPASFHAEFLRGDFAGWRSTVHTLYGDCAEEIIDRVLIETRLANPGDEMRSGAAHGL